MAKARIGPLSIIAVLFLLAILGSRLRVYETMDHVECAYRLATLDQDSADILFLGNSRIGAAIDPHYLGTLLENGTRRQVEVERLAMDANRPSQSEIFAREYVRHRGYPETVVIQLMYGGLNVDSADVPIHGSRNIVYGRLSDLADIQTTARMNGRTSFLSRRFHEDYESLPVVGLHKLTANIYAPLRIHARIIGEKLPDCSGDMRYRINERYVFGEAALADGIPPAPDPEIYQAVLDRKKIWMPLAPTAPYRLHVNHSTERLVTLFRDGGAEVKIMLLPVIGERVSRSDLAELQALFPGVEIIDTNGPFLESLRASERNYFKEENHVTREGARIITRHVAGLLADGMSRSDAVAAISERGEMAPSTDD